MSKTSIAIKIKQAKAEKVFLRSNPEWTVIQPWKQSLKLQYNPAEWMMHGKFEARGPLGNTRTVSINMYRDGIRVF
jgi:hypothetical protein